MSDAVYILGLIDTYTLAELRAKRKFMFEMKAKNVLSSSFNGNFVSFKTADEMDREILRYTYAIEKAAGRDEPVSPAGGRVFAGTRFDSRL